MSIPLRLRTRIHGCSFLFLTVVICAVFSATADDIQYVSETELADEVARRTGDIARTQSRLADLEEQAIGAEQERREALEMGGTADKRAFSRAGILYRLSRQGGAVRYLLNAQTAVDLLERLALLRRLLFDSLESRRQAGLRIAEAEKQVTSILEEKKAAYAMHQMIEEALLDLEVEQKRRKGTNSPPETGFLSRF